jgi:signal recognition particle subunit SRP68
LLDELAERAETSRDQALATLFADEIGPEIRYCAHGLGRDKAYDVDAIVKELAGRHRGDIVEGYDGLIKTFRGERAAGSAHDKKKLETLIWEGQPVPVRNPELVDVLLKIQEAEGKIAVPRDTGDDKGKKKGKGLGSKKGVAAYDAILLALSDAEDVARKLLEAQQVC